MRLQATPGRTDYVLKKNEADMRTLEQGFKQQLVEFDQQALRDFDKKTEEQQVILQQAGMYRDNLIRKKKLGNFNLQP